MQQNLVTLVNSSLIRTNVMYNGRPHIVVPSKTLPFDVVMNRILYPKEQILNNYKKLDKTPAPIGHPKDSGGKFISAKEQEGRNLADVGAWTRNVEIVGNRVESEVWIDTIRANQSPEGRELLQRIEQGKPISTSVAVLAEKIPQKGGNYDYVANIKDFDHNAILFDEAPAASIEQGVGLLVHTASAEEAQHTIIEKHGIIQKIEQLFNRKDNEMEEKLKAAEEKIKELEAKLADQTKPIVNEQLTDLQAQVGELKALLNAKAEDELKALRAEATKHVGEVVANQLNKEGLDAIIANAGQTAPIIPNSAAPTSDAPKRLTMEEYRKGLQ